jgi:hypothetical protein
MYLNAGCWLEESLHPEGAATGQLIVSQGFPWFSSVAEQMLIRFMNTNYSHL